MWKYVEKPFRNREIVRLPTFCKLTGIVVCIVVSLGIYGTVFHQHLESTWLSQQPQIKQLTYKLVNQNAPASLDYGSSPDNQQEISACRFNIRDLDEVAEERILKCQKTFGSGVLVLGDSHAIDLFGVLASRFENKFLVGVTKGACRPHSNFPYCHYDDVRRFVEKNSGVFRKIIFEQAGFYLLAREDGEKGSREMFSDLQINEDVGVFVPDIDHISRTANYLEVLSSYAEVVWFLPRAAPLISGREIINNGCDVGFHYRPNQYETFKKLDSIISELVGRKNIVTISQNNLFNFSFPSDFMNCHVWYWSDTDHFSTAGEIRFGARLPSSFLD